LQLPGRSRDPALFATERGFQALFHKPFTNIAHGVAMTAECFSDLLVGPVRSVGVCLEQDVGMLDPKRSRLASAGQVLKLPPLLVGQSHHILHCHRMPPVRKSVLMTLHRTGGLK
jgi:hypothetical protein